MQANKAEMTEPLIAKDQRKVKVKVQNSLSLTNNKLLIFANYSLKFLNTDISFSA